MISSGRPQIRSQEGSSIPSKSIGATSRSWVPSEKTRIPTLRGGAFEVIFETVCWDGWKDGRMEAEEWMASLGMS